MAAPAGSKTLQRIQAKAMRDASFRRALKRNPRKALADAGYKLPSGATIKVHENSARTFHLVLPPKPAKVKKSASRRPKRPGRMGPQFTIPV